MCEEALTMACLTLTLVKYLHTFRQLRTRKNGLDGLGPLGRLGLSFSLLLSHLQPYTCIYIQIYTCVYIHIYIHIHTYTHMALLATFISLPLLVDHDIL